jgi:hypothetical protein
MALHEHLDHDLRHRPGLSTNQFDVLIRPAYRPHRRAARGTAQARSVPVGHPRVQRSPWNSPRRAIHDDSWCAGIARSDASTWSRRVDVRGARMWAWKPTSSRVDRESGSARRRLCVTRRRCQDANPENMNCGLRPPIRVLHIGRYGGFARSATVEENSTRRQGIRTCGRRHCDQRSANRAVKADSRASARAEH